MQKWERRRAVDVQVSLQIFRTDRNFYKIAIKYYYKIRYKSKIFFCFYLKSKAWKLLVCSSIRRLGRSVRSLNFMGLFFGPSLFIDDKI